MSRVQLKLLGGFEARLASGPVIDIASRKARGLLAYLALPVGRAHARDKLVTLLWSERGDKQARDSLRQALSEIGRALGAIDPSPLIKERDTIALAVGVVDVDALEFERLAVGGDAGDLRRAAALYTGDLLDGVGVRDPAFEDWFRFERQRLRDLATTILRKLLALERGQPAVEIAQRLLALDPLLEEGHRALMRLHAEGGEIGAALRQYEACCDMLKREFNLAPSSETEELHREIRDGPAGFAMRRSYAAAAPATRAQADQPSDAESSSRPSVAVLPFTLLSGELEHRYFSDGITEDIITGLSRFRQLIVIARHSSFEFRDIAADVKRVGQQLGVRYVVEGSVRQLGERIRIAARLIDAADGAHLWTECYDRGVTDIFAIEDEVVQSIVGTLVRRLEHAVTERARRRPTNSLAAYDCFLRAHHHLWRIYYDTEAYYRDGLADARRMCERAIELDPGYARAHACLGIVHLFDWLYRGQNADLDRAVDLARAAVGLDEGDDWCHACLGVIHLKRAEHDLAAFHFDRAVALNPNDADAFCQTGLYMVYVGQPLQAVEWLDRAMRLNPYCPDYYHETIGMARYLAHRFGDGVAALRRMRKLSSWGRAYLGACYAQLGRLDAARSEIAEYMREVTSAADRPEIGAAMRLQTHIAALVADLRTHKNPADCELWLDGLRKAGLPVQRDRTHTGPASPPASDFASTAVGRPSLTVLPFHNLSGDPAQRYFSDGITEDLITELSRFHLLTVIARHSSFAVRDQGLEVTEIGKRLGASYVVEGSVRRGGERLRITVRLVEAESGNQLWSERYDRALTDIFDVQDEVVQAMVATLSGRIEAAGAQSARRKRPENMEAYDYLLRGLERFRTFDDADSAPARDMFEKALALDPALATAYVCLAALQLRHWWGNRSRPALDRAFALTRQAVALDGNDADCHAVLGYACLERREYDDAAFHMERAVALNPNDPDAALCMAALLAYVGRAEDGVGWMEKAFRLNPFPPQAYYSFQGMVLYAARRYAEAIAAFRRLMVAAGDSWNVVYQAASHGQSGHSDEGRAAIAAFEAAGTGLSLLQHAAHEPYRDSADLEHLLDGLRKAGARE